MIMWSNTLTSNKAVAVFILSVIFLSVELGFSVPLGWLCVKIMATDSDLTITASSTLKSTKVPVIPPLESSKTPFTLLALFSNNTLKLSCTSMVLLSQQSYMNVAALCEPFIFTHLSDVTRSL